MANYPGVTLYDSSGAPLSGTNPLPTVSSSGSGVDGAAAGSGITAEYGFNSGGPGGGTFDLIRTLQGKGVTANTLNGGASLGQNQAFLNIGPVPVVGQPVFLLGNTPEAAYVKIANSNALTFTANLAITHDNATAVIWDTYSPLGPGTSGFLPTGVDASGMAMWDSVASLLYLARGSQGVAFQTSGGASTTAIAAGTAGNTVIKASRGRLCRVLLTSVNGATAVQIFDNATTASGTVIGHIAASTVAGTLVDFQMPAANGITVGGAATNGAMTVSFY